jgi:hypothetical protein
MAQSRSDIGDQEHQGYLGRVHRGQVERRLAGEFGGSAHGCQQPRLAGNGLHLGLRIGRPTVPVHQLFKATARALLLQRSTS